MKNRLVVLLAGLSLGVLAACGPVEQAEVQGDAQFEPAQVDPQTKEPFCYACPLEPVQAQGMSTRQPVMDEKTGMYVCPTCPGSTFCGDGICQYPESYSSCSQDCPYVPPAAYCGDGACNGSETCSSCSRDCICVPSTCGNGLCQAGENKYNCPSDCPNTCLRACPIEP